MIILAKVVGGSHMYGLNTPESDYDERYVFMHDELSRTIGLDRYEHQDERGGEQDKFGFELRHYLNLLRKTNTQVVELLFADEYIYVHPLFRQLLINNRLQLLDTERMYKSLRGYIHGERRLANGERTGLLGGKRKAAVEKYGFSYKNFVQLFRLAFCGRYFIQHQIFPTRIETVDKNLHNWLMELKTHPEKFTCKQLDDLVTAEEALLEDLFENRDKSKDLKFNEELANNILLQFYFPVLEQLYSKLITK